MVETLDDIYNSENGDRWQLIRDAGSGRLFVRHSANQAAGGHITETAVENFLNQGGSGPEYAALRGLVEARSHRASDPSPRKRKRH